MAINGSQTMFDVCEYDPWKCTMEHMNFLQSIFMGIVACFSVAALFVASIYGIITFRKFRKVKHTVVKNLWFRNIAVCQKRYNITKDRRMDTLKSTAEKEMNDAHTIERNILRRAVQLLQQRGPPTWLMEATATDDPLDNYNPLISRILVQKLSCQPDPARFSILSLWPFEYYFLDIMCYLSNYHFIYYYDYCHQKPILKRLELKDSQFDHIWTHLMSHHILSELVEQPEMEEDVEFPNPDITLQVLLLAIHMTYLVPPKIRFKRKMEFQLGEALKLVAKDWREY